MDSGLKSGVAVGVGLSFESASEPFWAAALTSIVSAVARRKPKARRSKGFRKAICLLGAARLFEEALSITMTLLNSGGEQSFEQNTVFMVKSARPSSIAQPASLIWKND